MPLVDGGHLPVLVVGAGPVGLTLGLLLARSMVDVTIIERHPGVSLHPKARGVFPRTMEIFRQLNIADDLLDISTAIAGEIHHVTSASSLAAPDHDRHPIFADVDLTEYSQFNAVLAGQDIIERLLLRRAKFEHMPVHFSTELIALEQHDDHVAVQVRDRASGAVMRMTADYVVGCDGARSFVRSASGIAFEGEDSFGSYINVLFDADIAHLVADRRSVGYQVTDANGSIMTVDNRRRWLFNFRVGDEGPDAWGNSQLVERLRRGIGLPDIEPEVVSAVHWSPAAKLASAYRQRRVLLAGDAAHVVPPVGATGMNTGVQDAHNLAWKLAGVVNGTCHPSILDTYEAERRPIGERTVVAAAANQRATGGPPPGSPAVGGERQRPPSLAGGVGLTLGYAYSSTSIIDDNEQPAPVYPDDAVVSTGRPGERTPHVRIQMGVRSTTPSAMVGPGFGLFGGPEALKWSGSIPMVNVIAVMPPMDPQRRFADAFGIGPSGVVLIRPDNVIAWRQTEWSADGIERLQRAHRRVRGYPD
jgi:putative polyketide hydroxylase